MAEFIKSVYGAEPNREGEYPVAMIVGSPFDHLDRVIASIDYEEQNMGTYGIFWFVSRNADGVEIARMNALHVAAVIKDWRND